MSRQSFEHRQPLLLESIPHDSSDKEYSFELSLNKPKRSWRLITLIFISVLSLLLNVAQLITSARATRLCNRFNPPQLYTPVQDALQYELRKFSRARGISPYHSPPSDAVDQAWQDLYHFGVSRIPKSQAALLPNRTVALPGKEMGNYAISLDIFHQLHCLNQIRMALHPERYPPMPIADGFDHIDHCINSLRESLMCSVDVTPNIWMWNEGRKRYFPRVDTVHTCRNFNKVRDWAIEHQLDELILTVHVEDDLEYDEF